MKEFIAPELKFEPFGIRDVISASETTAAPTEEPTTAAPTTSFTPELPPDEFD